MSSWVLDASALMAVVNSEPGAGRVEEALDAGATMSTVNLSEVVAKLAEAGLPEQSVLDVIGPVGLQFAVFDAEDAVSAGLLRLPTRSAGLSFGDRACLALASRIGVPVLTADRAWAAVDLDGVEVQFIR